MEIIRHLREYLEGERQAALVLIGIGLVTAAAASLLFSLDAVAYGKSLFQAALCFSYLQLFRGGLQLLRTSRLHETLPYQARSQPALFFEEERKRTDKLAQQLKFYMTAEMAFFAFGLVMTLTAGVVNGSYFMLGMGIGCLVQSALLLSVDLFSSLRLGLYRDFLS
ncbi:MAG: hypothetical protein WA004_08630 [Saprospiraceae bacterium]